MIALRRGEKAITCLRCKQLMPKTCNSHVDICRPCSTEYRKEGKQAVAAITTQVRKGLMPRAAELPCTDCPAPAFQYDHRDYTRPLDVQPVCRSCNQKRGQAFDSVYRPAQELAHG